MSAIQNLKFLGQLVQAKVTGKRFPAHVAISVTNRCNLTCDYCFASYNAHESDDITLEKMIALVDELAALGTRLINLTGGEPLIRDDIKEIIDYITVKKGMKCSLSTNGLPLREKFDALENISSINISLDGDEAQHNNNRGPQNYAKIIDAIEFAVDNKLQVSTCTVLNNANKNCVDEVIELAKEKKVLSIFHFPYGRIKEEDNKQFDVIGREDTQRIMQKIIDYKDKGYPVYYCNKTHAYIRDWPYEKLSKMLHTEAEIKDKDFEIIPCKAGDLYCFIDANGRVYPCSVLTGQAEVLNFLEVGFQKAWDHLPKIKCKACAFFFQNELSLILSLDPSAWKNYLKSSSVPWN
ncbi:MAG: hypothetical protein COV66_10715 [Nitrospinae bacterium CG11_big_fil_rev_8_21_14_0_20_45_15]|nr:MAG: hypothetical protein COV66_10715 [Nitrospinae bacterium CG11_big_fil_rev_8_21_14_0_20_45_15]